MNAGIRALNTLTRLGYRTWLEGESIRLKWEGPGEPSPAQVKPLLEAVKTHKPEVVGFLRCYCPKCGGVVFCSDYEGRGLCLRCDWQTLTEIFPALRTRH